MKNIFDQNVYTIIKETKKEIVYSVVCDESVHLTGPFIRTIPDDFLLILILNGVSEENENEINTVIKNHSSIITVKNQSGQWRLSHGGVITELCHKMSGDFFILDPDCFVFDKNIFKMMSLAPGEIAASPLYFYGSHGLPCPRTYCIKLRPSYVAEIMEKYSITCEIYSGLPLHLKNPVYGEIFSPYWGKKQYFDTLQLLLAKPLNPYTIKFIDPVPGAIEHIGGTVWGLSGLQNIKNIPEFLAEDPLNIHIVKRCSTAIYFHLLFFEKNNSVNKSFHAALVKLYESSENFLKKYKQYINAAQIKTIIERLP
jgi:hypothetical protein